jgi:hypothetical protein
MAERVDKIFKKYTIRSASEVLKNQQHTEGDRRNSLLSVAPQSPLPRSSWLYTGTFHPDRGPQGAKVNRQLTEKEEELVMKKLSVLLVLTLIAFVVAGTGFAQTSIPAKEEMLTDLNFPPLPPDDSIVGLQQLIKNNFGDNTARLYQKVKPCRVLDTRNSPEGYIRNGLAEARYAPVAGCLNDYYMPNEWVDVVIQVTAIGVQNWYPAGLLKTTSQSSPQQVGLALGLGEAPVVYFWEGQVSQRGVVVRLQNAPANSRYAGTKVIGLYAENGSTHAIVDVIGFTIKRAEGASAGTPGTMVWRGAWDASKSYSPDDVVSSVNGTWIRTAGGWDLVSGDKLTRTILRTCLLITNDYVAFKACAAPNLQ